MSARAAWRLESLGFQQVYDYVGGKADWFAAGLPMEGAVDTEAFIGHVARRDVPTCALGETVAAARERLGAARWSELIVVNAQRVVLGLLDGQALSVDPGVLVESAMDAAPVTFRPTMSVKETVTWMERTGADSVLVTSSDGTLIGVVRREDLTRSR